MKKIILKFPILFCCVIFVILIAVQAYEAVVLRMDETVFSENFLNKLFGILLLGILMKLLGWNRRDIGFSEKQAAKGIISGLLFAGAVFFLAYAVEREILLRQGKQIHFGIFTTGFSLTGNTTVNNGLVFILMCIFFNIINLIMEEGVFRGLFYHVVKAERTVKTAVLVQAFLFGLWHIVTPFRDYIDGQIGFVEFVGMSIAYIILAGIMGIKWAFLYQLTDSLYMGMADHFYNNCISTNLLHITTETGTDELMIVRVLIAQLLSFIIVALVWSIKRRKHLRSNVPSEKRQLT